MGCKGVVNVVKKGLGDGSDGKLEVITKEGFFKRGGRPHGTKSAKFKAPILAKKETALCA